MDFNIEKKKLITLNLQLIAFNIENNNNNKYMTISTTIQLKIAITILEGHPSGGSSGNGSGGCGGGGVAIAEPEELCVTLAYIKEGIKKESKKCGKCVIWRTGKYVNVLAWGQF